MRKIIFLLLTVAAMYASAQTRSLVGVLTVKPKLGQKAAFEAAWKAHLQKFHQQDTTNSRGVYEITSGARTGCYYLVSSGLSWADMDMERASDKQHDLDYETTVTSKLEWENASEIFRWADTLSYRPEVEASKFLITNYHIKTGKQSEVVDEVKRAIAVNKKINSPVSYDGFIQQLTGSKPAVVIIRHLKEGFKELDADFNKGLNEKFKTTYIEMYGWEQWQKRVNAISETMELVEQEMVKYRADLSSAR